MPEKDGAGEKTTKSVVNKKQKQMMGEEGYDHLRDMGRIRKNKKKKDATTMPPSKEMEKTRKVNKGPSALDIVKKKYKGQIMKMEELDLTQVAEAFGGYIVEKKKSFNNKKSDAASDAFKDLKKDPIMGKVTPEVSRDIKTTQRPKRVTNRMAKTFAKQDIEKTGDKFVGGANLKNLGKSKKPKKIKLGEFPGAGPVKIYNIKDKPTPKPRVFSYMRKISPEAQKKVDAIKKEIEIKNIIKPDRRLKSSRVATSSPEFGKPKIPSTKKSSVKLTKPSDVELPKSFKDFSSKLKSLKADIKQTKTKAQEMDTIKVRSASDMMKDYQKKVDVRKPDPVADRQRIAAEQDPKSQEIRRRVERESGTKIRDFTKVTKDIKKKFKEIKKEPVKKALIPTVKAAGKSSLKTLKRIVKNPVGTAIAAGVARDSFRMPQLPPMPKLQGGKVGRRTAG